MADNDSEPPGWPFDEEPPPIPPAPEPASYEPPPATHPAPAAPVPPPPAAYPPPMAAAPAPPYQPVGAPGYQSPGQPPPPHAGWVPAPKKSNKNVFITVAVIVGILVLAIGSCTVWFVSTVKAPVDEANRFLALIDDADYQAAAAMVPVGCDGNPVSASGLEELFGGEPITYDLKNSQVINRDATVSGGFSSSFRSSRSIEVYLRNRGGWSVCGFTFGA